MSASVPVTLDYVVLGQTVPERRIRTGVIQVCSAGYSPTLRQLVRLYPLPVSLGGKRWHRYIVPVERNPQDWRKESLRIAAPDRHESLDRVADVMNLDGIQDRVATLAELERMRLKASSIDELNEKRLSLGLIDIKDVQGVWAENAEHEEFGADQLTLFNLPQHGNHARSQAGRGDITRRAYPVWSRLQFCDAHGRRDLMFNSWDVYEWLRKFGQGHAPDDVWSRYKLGDPAYRHLALVGNMAQHPNRWLVISLFHLPCAVTTFAQSAGQLSLAGLECEI